MLLFQTIIVTYWDMIETFWCEILKGNSCPFWYMEWNQKKKIFTKTFFFMYPPIWIENYLEDFSRFSKKNFFFLCLFHISKWTWITLQNITLKSFWHIPVSHSIGLKLLHFMEAEVTILNHYSFLDWTFWIEFWMNFFTD